MKTTNLIFYFQVLTKLFGDFFFACGTDLRDFEAVHFHSNKH